MSYTIPGLVAESISQKLFDKILSKTLKPIIKNVIFYIKQDTGDDTVADGSKEKPFKSLSKCLDYIKLNYFFAKNDCSIVIDFLSDYEEVSLARVCFTHILGASYANSNYIFLKNTLNKNVILGNILIHSGNVNISNVTFKDKVIGNAYPFIMINNYGLCSLNNVKLDISSLSEDKGYLILTSYLSYLNLNSITLLGSQESYAIDYIFGCYANSCFLYNGSTNITDTLAVNNGFIYCGDNAETRISKTCSFTNKNNLIGKRYRIAYSGNITTYAMGEERLPGTQSGIVEYNGYYC